MNLGSADAIKAALSSSDPEIRRTAAGQLEKLPDSELSSSLCTALGDTDWRVRKETVGVCSRLILRPGVADAVVSAICQGENVGLRTAALEVIDQTGPVTFPLLSDLAASATPAIQTFIAQALGNTRDARALPALERMSSLGHPNVQAAAIDALARVGGPHAERVLRQKLISDDVFERMAAIDALDRLGVAVEWSVLSPLLGDKLTKRVALGLIARCTNPEAAAVLVETLSDSSANAVSSALRSLDRMLTAAESLFESVAGMVSRLPTQTIDSLRQRLIDPSVHERGYVASVLVLARDVKALPEIVDLISQGSLSNTLANALRKWGTDAIEPLLKVFEISDGTRRAVALELAADLASQSSDEMQERVRSVLRIGLTDPDPEVVVASARSMAAYAEASDAALLRRIAATNSESIAEACAKALEELARKQPDAVRAVIETAPPTATDEAALVSVFASVSGPLAIERLQVALSAEAEDTRRAALDALAMTSDSRAVELAILALADESAEVQVAAVNALAKLQDPESVRRRVDALVASLKSESIDVQAAAARALIELGDEEGILALRKATHGGSSSLVVAAIQASAQIGGSVHKDFLMDAVQHSDTGVVRHALQRLVDTMGSDERVRVAKVLISMLDHSTADVRATASRLLGTLQAVEAQGALEQRQRLETDPEVRLALNRALAAIGKVL